MAGKWFNNRGQIIQVVSAIVAVGIAIIVSLPALSQYSNLLPWLLVILVPVIALGAFSYGKNFAATAPLPPPVALRPLVEATSPEPYKPSKAAVTMVANALLETKEAFETEISFSNPTVKVGAFWTDPESNRRIRISVVALANDEEPRAELYFDTGALAHGGTQTKRVKVNQYLMRAASSGYQSEEFCVYYFSFEEKHIWFFAVRVEHINIHAHEVVLAVCKVSSFKRQRIIGAQ